MVSAHLVSTLVIYLRGSRNSSVSESRHLKHPVVSKHAGDEQQEAAELQKCEMKCSTTMGW
jgi:hypothetical protein